MKFALLAITLFTANWALAAEPDICDFTDENCGPGLYTFDNGYGEHRRFERMPLDQLIPRYQRLIHSNVCFPSKCMFDQNCPYHQESVVVRTTNLGPCESITAARTRFNHLITQGVCFS